MSGGCAIHDTRRWGSDRPWLAIDEADLGAAVGNDRSAIAAKHFLRVPCDVGLSIELAERAIEMIAAQACV